MLKDYDGKDLKQTEPGKKEEDQKPLKVSDALITCLNSFVKDEIPTAEDKNKIFQLSLKINGSKNGDADFTVDDLAFIKKRAGLVWNPLIYGRICEVIDGPVSVEEKEELDPDTKFPSSPQQEKESGEQKKEE